MENKETPENSFQGMVGILGKTAQYLNENGAYMTDKKIVIERNEDGYMQATVVITLY